MVSDLFAGTAAGRQVHPDYPVLRAPRGFLVSYSLPPVAIALGGNAPSTSRAARSPTRVSRGVTRLAQSEVVQMAVGEAAAAIDIGDASAALRPRLQQRRGQLGPPLSPTAEALRARRDMVYAQHQVEWAVERLCELSGARWIYDSDPLQEIRRDVDDRS